MNIATYARRNMFRRTGRTILTIIAVVVTVLIFCFIRTALTMWHLGVDEASSDRIGTRHKVSITMQLPRHYIDDLKDVPGVAASTWANWFGAKDPKERVPFFAGMAVDQNTWFDVMTEMNVTPQELADWKTTANGAIIGDKLAETFGVKVGDRIIITSDIYPGDWDFKIVGIYKPLKKSADRNSFIFRWDYLQNDARAVFSKDQIGWMMSRVTDASKSADISRAIDHKFDEKDDQTLTMSERALALSFLGGVTAIFSALGYVSLAILLIMMLILANTIAMSVRERTHEYGVLRAIGFPPAYIAGFIIAESMLVSLLGGLIGILVVWGLINNGIGPALEENMAGFFPYFRTPTSLMVIALGASVLLGALAGAIPAVLASRLKVTDALRRLD